MASRLGCCRAGRAAAEAGGEALVVHLVAQTALDERDRAAHRRRTWRARRMPHQQAPATAQASRVVSLAPDDLNMSRQR